MHSENISLKVEFRNSKEKRIVALSSLSDTVITFLEHYGEISVTGNRFYEIIGEGDGQTRYLRLLKAAGYENDPQGFFTDLIQILEQTNSYTILPLTINNVELPYLLVTTVLNVLIPGDKFHTIRNVPQLEKLTNIRVPEEERDDMQKVIEQYPVRISQHTIRQMRISEAISYQYLPFTDELNDEGFVHTWVGQFFRGIVEQMYQNRIIFILNMACPVYCRFCFRKHKECRNQKSPTQQHVKNALLYVKGAPDIKEIVLTGGDPFMNRFTLTYAIDGLRDIAHVQALRLATRSISYYPQLFYAHNSFWLNYLKRKYLELQAKGKKLELATHFIHPDEVSIESLDIISELTQNGIPVYVQTPLLKGCNDQGPELTTLFSKLRGAGAEMHYLYIPCSPIKGNRRFVSTIAAGIRLAAHMRAHLSDRAIPRICTATKIGKIDWNTSGWAVEKDASDHRYIWIRTPYTPEYFNTFAPILQLQDFARVNSEGTLDCKFMAQIGDEKLFVGSREVQTTEPIFPPERELTESSYDPTKDELIKLQKTALEDQRFKRSIVATGSETLFRTHLTRVELDLDADEQEMNQNLEYIRGDAHITDIVLSRKDDVLSAFYRLKRLYRELEDIPHISAIRLRSHKFNYRPEVFLHTLIHQLGKLNDVSIVNPKRLEIETQFLHSDEFTPKHLELNNALRQHGVTVYNITPLLPFINDSGDEILNIAFRCREYGIEFHHLYITGLPVQEEWSREYPVDISILIDIATRIRRHESGRGIPRFIIRTQFGEVDFNLTSEIVDSDEKGRVLVKLLPYTREYFKMMQEDFEWPENTVVGEDGHPVIPLQGLKRTPHFLFDDALSEQELE